MKIRSNSELDPTQSWTDDPYPAVASTVVVIPPDGRSRPITAPPFPSAARCSKLAEVKAKNVVKCLAKFGSFLAVPAPMLASEYAVCSFFQDLQHYLADISNILQISHVLPSTKRWSSFEASYFCLTSHENFSSPPHHLRSQPSKYEVARDPSFALVSCVRRSSKRLSPTRFSERCSLERQTEGKRSERARKKRAWGRTYVYVNFVLTFR